MNEYWIILLKVDEDEAKDPAGYNLITEDMIYTNQDGMPCIYKSQTQAEYFKETLSLNGKCVQLPVY